jgi:hypothetical protein
MLYASDIGVPTSHTHPHTHIWQGGAAEDQSRAVGATDIRPSCRRPRCDGADLVDGRPFCDFYPVKEKRTSEEAARGGRRRTCHPWRGLGDSRSRSRPDGWHVAGWLARQAKFFRRVLGRGPERRGGSLGAPWLRGLRGWGHGMLHRLFAPDAEVGGRWLAKTLSLKRDCGQDLTCPLCE